MNALADNVAVQIVNYNTRAHLERCVESLRADLDSSPIEYRIEVLDNASADDLSSLPGRFDRLRVHHSATNLGFGAGHNLLAREACAERLLILNPDVQIVAPDTVVRLLAALRGTPGAAVVGPRLVDARGASQRYDHGRLHGLRARVALAAGDSYWRASDRRREVAWVSGAAMLVMRSEFAAVGGFDEGLFLYKEEEDLCLRLRRRGGRILYEPSVVVRHEGSVVARREEHIGASVEYFVAKHHPHRRRQRALARLHRTLQRLP
ncbi:MAG TPA: glycosyltransferase family 2 protein [Solirubrobacteraceae bacterium]|jgi:hypothetical protein|nr:glycosyltransferase family 2 protein [Solirubrobacteraceae bacterium]